MQWTRGAYTIDDDPARIDHDAVRRFLADAYWASDRPADVIEHSLEHSLTFGLYHDGAMVGLTRVITDRATFAWVCDVYVEAGHRGGLGRWLLETVLAHPELATVRRWLLATQRSRTLYERLGFAEVEPGRYFVLTR